MYRILWITENGLPTLLVRFIPSIFYLLKPRFYLRASECQNIFPLPCLLRFLFQYFCNYNRYCRKGSKDIIHQPCCLKASFSQTPQFDTPENTWELQGEPAIATALSAKKHQRLRKANEHMTRMKKCSLSSDPCPGFNLLWSPLKTCHKYQVVSNYDQFEGLTAFLSTLCLSATVMKWVC